MRYFLAHSAARESRRAGGASPADNVVARARKKYVESYIARDYGRARSVIYVANKVLRINIILGRTLDARAAAFSVFNSAIMRRDLSLRPRPSLFQGIFPSGGYSAGVNLSNSSRVVCIVSGRVSPPCSAITIKIPFFGHFTRTREYYHPLHASRDSSDPRRITRGMIYRYFAHENVSPSFMPTSFRSSRVHFVHASFFGINEKSRVRMTKPRRRLCSPRGHVDNNAT